MERERWVGLYQLACEVSRSWGFGHRYSVACIVGVFLWAAVHDRPISWACRAENWPQDLRRGRLPSQSTMSRRLRTKAVQDLLKLMEHALKISTSPPPEADPVQIIDAKPLPIGSYSKDPDARWGRACGTMAKGYKLYAVWGASGMPEAWCVRPMNVSEKSLADELLRRLPGRGWLLADSQYDSNELFDLAFEQGWQLLAPRRKKGRFGHHYLSPHRRFAVQVLEGDGWRPFHRERTGIERKFGNCTSFGGGLGPLPSWVRRLPRVHLWVQAKLLINAQRIRQSGLAIA
jgi:Transposase DDE domain